MVVWPQGCLKLISGKWRTNSHPDTGGRIVILVSLFTACCLRSPRFSLYSWIVAGFPMSCAWEGIAFAPGLCSRPLLPCLCPFLRWCFPLEQPFGRRRAAQQALMAHFCSSHLHLSVVHDAHRESWAVQNAGPLWNQETTPPNSLLSLGKLEQFCIVSGLVQAVPLPPVLRCSL